MLSIIVAKAKNNAIGKDNKLLWHISDDLKRFRKLTENHTIIMGRKTFEALGRVLPNRKHIVFSQNPDFKVKDENVEVVHSMLQIQEYIEGDEEAFVIGGAIIYNLLMPYVTKMYVTEIDKDFDGVSDDELKKEFAADVVINNVSTSLSSCEFISAIWNSYSKSVTALNPFSITFASYSFAKSTKRPLKLTTSTLGKCCVTLFISSTLSLIENNPTLSILTSTPTINLSKTLAPLVIISK